MTRGTTPSYEISFKETFDFAAVDIWSVTLKQWKTEITIDDPDIDYENSKLDITLTQEQTLQFAKGTAELQVRGVFGDGTAFASNIGCVPINPVLDERVLGGLQE